MKKGTVKQRILFSNVLMVLVTLVIFLAINMFIIFCYSESIEDEVKTTIEKVVEPKELDDLFKHYTVYRNEFIILFGVDGILCIVGLVIVSRFFTKSLTERIMEPLNALVEGTERIKSNDLSQEIVYKGDREFEEVCSSFNDMMNSLSREQEKNRKYEKARTDMIAGISHDLRTPLTAVKGTIKALLDGVASEPEQVEKFLETAYRRTGDMDRLLNQLFYLSKIETGNMPVLIDYIDIGAFLNNYVNGKMACIDENDGMALNLSMENVEEKIAVDPEQLQRILDNLLENSRKYADNDKLVVDFILSKTQKGCCICVRDNGMGVPEEKMPYIFDEFYRADESRNKKEGNGLGLYIVKCLMDEMGGSVCAKSQNGFEVYLDFNAAGNRR